MLKIRWDTHIPGYESETETYTAEQMEVEDTLENAKEIVEDINNSWSLLCSHYVGEAWYIDSNGKETSIYRYCHDGGEAAAYQ